MEQTDNAAISGMMHEDVCASESVDVFHRGRFSLIQPVKCGHRSGMDAMMLAAAVPNDFSGKLADLGAGAGAAGFAVAARCPKAYITLIERSFFMLSYAEKSRNYPDNAYLRDRIDIIEADVTETGRKRIAAGLQDNSYDFVIMNPPFNLKTDRATPDTTKAEAHVMEEGLFETWLRTAAAIARPGGGLALIARPSSLDEILSALQRRFGSVKLIPVYSRPGRDAIRIIIYARKGSRAGLSFAPPVVLHGKEGNTFSVRVDGINNGKYSLWDEIGQNV